MGDFERDCVEYVCDRIRAKWDAHGQCQSCGWHAALYEYEPLADSVDFAKDRTEVRLQCLSDDENRLTHRGVRIPLD